jgi:hypothetical protein
MDVRCADADTARATEGCHERALTLTDAETAVMMALELGDVGQMVIEEAVIVTDWQPPSYDLSASSALRDLDVRGRRR